MTAVVQGVLRCSRLAMNWHKFLQQATTIEQYNANFILLYGGSSLQEYTGLSLGLGRNWTFTSKLRRLVHYSEERRERVSRQPA